MSPWTSLKMIGPSSNQAIVISNSVNKMYFPPNRIPCVLVHALLSPCSLSSIHPTLIILHLLSLRPFSGSFIFFCHSHCFCRCCRSVRASGLHPHCSHVHPPLLAVPVGLVGLALARILLAMPGTSGFPGGPSSSP